MLMNQLAEIISPVANAALVYIAFAVFKIERRVTKIELRHYMEDKQEKTPK